LTIIKIRYGNLNEHSLNFERENDVREKVQFRVLHKRIIPPPSRADRYETRGLAIEAERLVGPRPERAC
jgi:hypothetical protein